MPLTFAHPAAVVPLARRGLVFSALVVGSMSPDFEYFITLSTKVRYGHTLPGAFLFSLPAGLAGLWVFHAFLKRPLLHLLPASQQQRLWPLAGDFRFGPGGRFLLIVVSVLLGIFTHLVWDSFTHWYSWGAQHVPFLTRVACRTEFGDIRWAQFLQYGSTLFGLAVLAISYSHWLQRAPEMEAGPAPQFSARTRMRIAFYLGFGAFLLTCAYAWCYWQSIANLPAVAVLFDRLIVAGISATLLELFLYGLWWQTVYGRENLKPVTHR